MGRPRLITAEIEQQIVTLYREGVKSPEISRRVGFSESIICRFLRRHGLTNRITEDVELKIVEACRNGSTGITAAKHFGISRSSVSNILHKHGIETKIGKPTTCALDDTVFDNLTPESAYWMGFLFADGSIIDKGKGHGSGSIRLGLSVKDREHVEKFRAFLKSTHKVHDVTVKNNLPNETSSKPRQAVYYSVRSQRLVNALRGWGMLEKNVDRAPVGGLEDSVDFWRGCVDGDGTVRIHHDPRRNYNYPQIILCGHMSLIESFQSFLLHHHIIANINPASTCIYEIRLMASPAFRVIKLLYANASTALIRKMETAREILKTHDHLG